MNCQQKARAPFLGASTGQWQHALGGSSTGSAWEAAAICDMAANFTWRINAGWGSTALYGSDIGWQMGTISGFNVVWGARAAR